MNSLNLIWIELGKPSFISAANTLVILVYFVCRLIDALRKDSIERKFEDEISLLNYRISKIRDEGDSSPPRF